MMWIAYGIYAIFFGLGLFSLITGRAYTRFGVIEGPRARFGGFLVLCMGGLIMIAVNRPDLNRVLLPFICLFPLSGGLAARVLFGSDEDKAKRF
jgi:hypothetical protein